MSSENGSGVKVCDNMKMWAYSIQHYLDILRQFIACTLKSLLEYRFNFLVQLIYAPAYVGVLFLILQIALSKTVTLGGWNDTQVIALFCTFNLLYCGCSMLFLKGVRHFLAYGIRLGEVDMALTKPLTPQFLLLFSKPELQQIVLFSGIAGLFVRTLWLLRADLTWTNLILFLLVFILGIITCYGTISLYATVGFFASRGVQVIEIADKTSDFSQYPLPIFPEQMQLLLMTLIPVAFFGYAPTLFLLGKGSWQWLVFALLAAIISTILSRLTWRHALKQYASASS